jgi:hypothetical protein
MKTIKGPGIFLAQFAGDHAPYTSLNEICRWAAGLGFKGLQIPKPRLGMVGGGPGAFIGEVHRIASRIDDRFELVAGALSSNPASRRWPPPKRTILSVSTSSPS